VASSRAFAAQLVAAETAAALADAAPGADVDTDDESHEVSEFEAWQQRELGRLAADRLAREAQSAEKEELARLRGMTQAERAAWEAEHPAAPPAAAADKEKRKWVFLQKYYHKGAFFQSGADDAFGTVGTFDILRRDFSEATGEDVGADRSLLPKPMQVRKGTFGRAGQTKWTHLSAEDTTAKGDDLWAAAKRGGRPGGAR